MSARPLTCPSIRLSLLTTSSFSVPLSITISPALLYPQGVLFTDTKSVSIARRFFYFQTALTPAVADAVRPVVRVFGFGGVKTALVEDAARIAVPPDNLFDKRDLLLQRHARLASQ